MQQHRNEVSIVAEKQYVSDNAQLMAEWDWEKNNELGLDPAKIACGSGKSVWWKCKNEHSWKCTPNARTTKNGTGCPYCSNHRVFAGYNDLCTLRPDLAKEWHPSKNKEIYPTQVSAGSSKKFGGFVKADMNIKHQLLTATQDMAVRIALVDIPLKDKAIYKQSIRLLQKNGTIRETTV